MIEFLQASGSGKVPPVHAVRSPLRRIFWGSILIVFDLVFEVAVVGDLTIDLDLVPDIIGMLLITLAVRELAQFADTERGQQQWTFVIAWAAVNTVLSLVPDRLVSEPWGFAAAADVVNVVAVVVFCLQMADICKTHRLDDRSAASWRTTAILTAALAAAAYVTIVYLVIWGGGFDGGQIEVTSIDGTLLVVVALVCSLVPYVHLLVSIGRTRRDANNVESTVVRF